MAVIDARSYELDGYEVSQTRKAKELLARVLGEVNRINRNTREYLAMARGPEVRLRAADLNPVIEGQLEFLDAELEQASVSVHLELGDGLPWIMLDVEQFRQVLLNLVKNSVDAMPGGDDLYVTTTCDGRRVLVEVRDTGGGIPVDL